MVMLRDGSTASSAEADALREDDSRSLEWSATMLPAFLEAGRPGSRQWELDVVLDQGLTGGCVGFAFAHWLAAEPCYRPDIDKKFAREVIYHGAQRIDRWPGGEYPGASPISSGTSVLAAAKVLHRSGCIGHYYWGRTLMDLIMAVGYQGPVVLGIDWYQGMKRPAPEMKPAGQLIGRHCLLVLGVTLVFQGEAINEEQSFFLFQNSSGRDWGEQGRAWMCMADLKPLLEGAEMCIPTPPVPVAAGSAQRCNS